MALPEPPNCQADLEGANDIPGQRDVTRFCIASSDGAPFDLYALISADEIDLSGNNSMDLCLLYNTDSDAFANLAVCVTLRSSGAVNNNLTVLDNIRLFTCNDTKADRCPGAVLVSPPYQTTCEVSHPDRDPFSPAAVNGPGSDYPDDSQVVCAVATSDFGTSGAGARLMDACAYPSTIPNSDPADCILFRGCRSAADCDDRNGCSLDTCDASGVCVHAPAGPIDCDDGLYCNGDETCNPLGFCGPGNGDRDCNDGVDCTIDDCDEVEDACVHDPRNSLCDDNLFCDGVETCDTWNGCRPGVPVDCQDGVSCTTDNCNEETDACDHAANDAACDDGLFCNGESTCDTERGCVLGPAPDCRDAVACTVDTCDEASHSCKHVANNGACDDGLFCDGIETCTAGGCVPGTPPNCNDLIGCTIDSCNEDADLCMHVPNNGACGNGTYCDGVEVCDPLVGCRAGTQPCEAPAVCNEARDTCVQCLTDAQCNNGVFCDGQEICNIADGTCRSGVPVNCDDGVACTMDSCDEVNDRCLNTANSALCDDGLFCNGTSTCDPAQGCVVATTDPCSDGIDCTTDSCIESTDQCTHTPDDSQCDDHVYCNGAETCEAATGCRHGEPVTCPADGGNCSVEQCDEDSRACISDRSNCVCGDGEITQQEGEECEPPRLAGTFEDCNNIVDDDGDGLADCADPDCSANATRGVICDENCKLDAPCALVARDPARIEFNREGGADALWLHGRFPVDTTPDPVADGFQFELSNDLQTIYRASLDPGVMRSNSTGTRFSFKDDHAQELGNDGPHGGLSRVGILFKNVSGVRYLSFRIRAYGDFSTATHRVMSSQIGVGGAVGTITKEWTAVPDSWILHQSDY